MEQDDVFWNWNGHIWPTEHSRFHLLDHTHVFVLNARRWYCIWTVLAQLLMFIYLDFAAQKRETSGLYVDSANLKYELSIWFIFASLILVCHFRKLRLCFYRKKIEEIGKMMPMSQDEIMSCTKTVVQGLDTLRVEHQQVLNSLLTSVKSTNNDNSSSNLSDEKVLMLKKGIEMIELALGEAQVIL